MALMESYYHGSSSGIDCLISLIDRPLIIKGRNEIELIDLKGIKSLGHFYLYESNQRRKTSPFVHSFLEDYDTDEQCKIDVHNYMELSDLLIKDFINLDKESFKQRMESLTKLQYLTFKKMIPRHVEKIWIDSIESKKYSVKLCGAGGGGFFLIYSPDERIVHPNFIEVQL
jgi:mevalonate kinase